MSNVTDLSRVRAVDGNELARLKAELEAARKRLEEESAYYQAELEAVRQRVEKQYMRQQAEEVAKRRRAEEQVQALKAALREAQAEMQSYRERYEAVAQQLERYEQEERLRAEEEIGKVRAAARAAWRDAEEEHARTEQELASVKRLLLQERERNKQLEETVSRLRAEKAAASRPDQESLRLIAALKKALWTTAQARRRAEMELARLQTADVARELRREDDESQGAPKGSPEAGQADGGRWNPGGYTELDSSVLKSLVIGSPDEIADEFLLMPADASLDPATFERLERMPETQDVFARAEFTRAEPPSAPPRAQTASKPRPQPEPPPLVAEPPPWRVPAAEERRRSRLWMLLQLVVAAVIGAGLVYALAVSGLLR